MAGYRFYPTADKAHDDIFKRLADGDLGLMSILHEAMHLPVRLVDDLRKILDRDK